MESTVPHAAAVAAVVNAPAEITLFAPSGTPVRVAEDQAAALLAIGFSRERSDPAALLAELEALIPNLLPAWSDYLGATEAAGHIDEAAMDVAHATIRLVAEAANKLHLAIHERYGVAERGAEDIELLPPADR